MPDEKEFAKFQRIRLKYIKEMLEQCEERTDAIAVLMVEKQAIEEYLNIR